MKCPGSIAVCNSECGKYVEGRGCADKVLAEELIKMNAVKKDKKKKK